MQTPGLRSLQRGAQIEFGVVVACALLVSTVGWIGHIPGRDAAASILYLAAATQLAALLPVRWRNGTTHSLVSAPLTAAGLFAPGGVVAVMAFVATFDGRVPNDQFRWWQFVWNRAAAALQHGLISLGVALLPITHPFAVPVKSLVYATCLFVLNYGLMARLVAFVRGTRFFDELLANLSVQSVQGMIVMGFGGGLLYLLVQDRIEGMIMGLGLLGFLLAVRGNMTFAIEQVNMRVQALKLAAQALDARDRYTEMHSVRVAELASKLGQRMGLSSRAVEDLSTAGALHDIGKIGIRDHILNKAGPLTPDEWDAMRAHAAIGADMIAEHSALAHLAPMVRHHHERWNGTGYPDGIRGEQIPLGARILAVADSFDTITGPRIYRPSSLTPIEGVEDISKHVEVWYDRQVVDALRDLYGLAATVPEAPRAAAAAIGAVALVRSNPRFAWLLAATSISALGDPLTTTATLVTVYGITRQPLLVAATYMVKAIATIVGAVFLGNLPDRLPKRPLILWTELSRALLLVATPALLNLSLGLIFPILFYLASVELLVQPARQAILPSMIHGSNLTRASATLSGAAYAASILGFPLAGLVLLVARPPSTTPLFFVDGVTFAVAGLLVMRLGYIGAGVRIQGSRFGAVGRAWRVTQVRPRLVTAGVAVFFIAIAAPNLITLAYHQVPRYGAQAYTLLEAFLGLGFVVGSVLVTFLRSADATQLERNGLAILGAFSLAIFVSPFFWLSALLIYLATVGNPLYTSGNQAALLAAGDDHTRGAIMATRLTVVQTTGLLGVTAGGVLGSTVGPSASFGVVGAGLLLVYLALYIREARANAPATAGETADPLLALTDSIPPVSAVGQREGAVD